MIRHCIRLSGILLTGMRLKIWRWRAYTPKERGLLLASLLEQLGPSFIKLGQVLSTRVDLVGTEIATALTRLQDDLPPFATKEAIHIIETDLGAPLTTLYQHFEEVPMAAASMAQVHRAITLDHKVVAVKILRPAIKQILDRDISLFFWIANIIEHLLPRSRRLKLVEVVRTLADTLHHELDLRLEAAAADELRENCRNELNLYVPLVDWQRTSKQVLTIEWIDGLSINNRPALLEAGHDLKKIAATITLSFLNQAYRDGFFHADIHPGNILVMPDGRVAVIDFGIMGRLDLRTRRYVAEILRGFILRDYFHVAKVHFAAGYVPPHHSVMEFAQACRSIGEPIVGKSAQEVSIAKLLGQLFQVTEAFDMETQPQLLLLQKTMVLVEGVGSQLDPEINMWLLAEPWAEEWAKKSLNKRAQLRYQLKQMQEFFDNLPEWGVWLHDFLYQRRYHYESNGARKGREVDKHRYGAPSEKHPHYYLLSSRQMLFGIASILILLKGLNWLGM